MIGLQATSIRFALDSARLGKPLHPNCRSEEETQQLTTPHGTFVVLKRITIVIEGIVGHVECSTALSIGAEVEADERRTTASPGPLAPVIAFCPLRATCQHY